MTKLVKLVAAALAGTAVLIPAISFAATTQARPSSQTYHDRTPRVHNPGGIHAHHR